MGCKALWKIVEQEIEKISDVNLVMALKQMLPLSYFQGLNVGIDASIYLCKLFYTLDPQTTDEQVIEKCFSYVQIASRIAKDCQVKKLIWYFDGKPLPSKTKTLEKREDQRKKNADRADEEMHQAEGIKESLTVLETRLAEAQASGEVDAPSKGILENQCMDMRFNYFEVEQKCTQHQKSSRKLARHMLKELQQRCMSIAEELNTSTRTSFNSYQVSFFQCEFETDFQISGAALAGDIDVVCSGDSDCFAAAVPRLCRDMPFQPKRTDVAMYYPPAFCRHLGWTKAMLVDFCLLLGHDEDDMTLEGIGPAGARDLIQKFKSIENILDEYDKYKQVSTIEAQEPVVSTSDSGAPVPSPSTKATKRKRAEPAQNVDKSLKKIKSIPLQYQQYLDETRVLFVDPPFVKMT